MTCPTCHRPSRYVVHEHVSLGRMTFRWWLCQRCWLRDDAQQEARAHAAIEQAERAGV